MQKICVHIHGFACVGLCWVYVSESLFVQACVGVHVCRCRHGKCLLGTCVFADRLMSTCVQIYIQLHLWGIYPCHHPWSTLAFFLH